MNIKNCFPERETENSNFNEMTNLMEKQSINLNQPNQNNSNINFANISDLDLYEKDKLKDEGNISLYLLYLKLHLSIISPKNYKSFFTIYKTLLDKIEDNDQIRILKNIDKSENDHIQHNFQEKNSNQLLI